MWPLTYATKCNFISYFFIGFAILPIMVNRRNYIHWLAIPPGARIRRNDHFLLLELLERSTNWFVDYSSIISTEEHKSSGFRGDATEYRNSGKFWFKSKHHRLQSRIRIRYDIYQIWIWIRIQPLRTNRIRTQPLRTNQICINDFFKTGSGSRHLCCDNFQSILWWFLIRKGSFFHFRRSFVIIFKLSFKNKF